MTHQSGEGRRSFHIQFNSKVLKKSELIICDWMQLMIWTRTGVNRSLILKLLILPNSTQNLQTQLNFSWSEQELTLFFAKNGQSNRNPHLASTIRNKANVWNFVAALRVFGGCLEVIHMVSGQYLMGAWRVYGLCLNGVYINFKKLGFLNHI